MTNGQETRKPAFAGSFYPEDRSELDTVVSSFLDKNSQDSEIDVHGLIVPHAGYIYSGRVAGAAFSRIDTDRLKECDIVTVFLLGPAHRVPVEGVALSGASSWESPLGKVPVSAVSEKMVSGPLMKIDDHAHAAEHSLEVQLPFLQKCLEGISFEIVPALIGDADPVALSELISPYLKEGTLLCVSTDLSHYLPYEQAKKLDRATIDAIKSFDLDGLTKQNTACGALPVLTAMHIAHEKKWSFTEVMYENSGDTAGDKSAVVGYVSMLMGGGADA